MVSARTRLVCNTNFWKLRPSDRVGQVSSTTFDAAGNHSAQSPAVDVTTFGVSSQYHPMSSPLRLLDTRNNGGRLGPNGDYVLAIGGVSAPFLFGHVIGSASDRTRSETRLHKAATREGTSAQPARPKISPSSPSIPFRSNSVTVAKRAQPCDQPPFQRREIRKMAANSRQATAAYRYHIDWDGPVPAHA